MSQAVSNKRLKSEKYNLGQEPKIFHNIQSYLDGKDFSEITTGNSFLRNLTSQPRESAQRNCVNGGKPSQFYPCDDDAIYYIGEGTTECCDKICRPVLLTSNACYLGQGNRVGIENYMKLSESNRCSNSPPARFRSPERFLSKFMKNIALQGQDLEEYLEPRLNPDKKAYVNVGHDNLLRFAHNDDVIKIRWQRNGNIEAECHFDREPFVLRFSRESNDPRPNSQNHMYFHWPDINLFLKVKKTYTGTKEDATAFCARKVFSFAPVSAGEYRTYTFASLAGRKVEPISLSWIRKRAFINANSLK
jgi:hypothetical protein